MQQSIFLGVISYLSTGDKPGLFSISFCYICTSLYRHILGQQPYTIHMMKRIQEKAKMLVTYIFWLSCTFAVVVTSAAVRGTKISSVIHVRCSLYPDPLFSMAIFPPCICINARTRYYSFSMAYLCHTLPFAFSNVLSIAVIEMSTTKNAL
jgi:hypothetical protein